MEHEVKAACRQTKHTAGGLDGWAPDDRALFTDTTYSFLAVLLNNEERTGRWPTDMQQARAVFLETEPGGQPTALGVRILLTLPLLYRK